MTERRQILTLVVVTLLIGILTNVLVRSISGFASDGDIAVEEYEATFYTDGSLVEEFTYTIRKQSYRMLYRYWDAPLSIDSLGQPYVELVKLEAAATGFGYFKDSLGTIYVDETYPGSSIYKQEIGNLAYRNEAGSYNPDYYRPGTYTTRYTFKLHPPLEYDDEDAHFNLMLAREHMAYQKATLGLGDAGYIQKFYTHPPYLKVSREGGRIVVSGSSGEDELLEVEMVMSLSALSAIDGFPQRVENVRTKTVNANRNTSLQYGFVLALAYLIPLLSLLMPFLLYGVYNLYGREREYTVPEYLSTIPNRERKPWLVNQVFTKGAYDYDDDGFYATLLDLHVRKKIQIEEKPGGLVIRLIDIEVEDVYERRVIGFLQMIAEDNVVDTDRLGGLAKAIKSGEKTGFNALLARNRLADLTTTVDQRATSEFVVQGRQRLYPVVAFSTIPLFLSIAAIALVPFARSTTLVAFVSSFVLIIQSAVALFYPPELFGRWKGDSYREKL
ncbi:DUF2207 domain-containing protein, partial [Candidatus Bathyarchaeota archaeon]|nr:DUF2207 domain-containing protein [Candidatus Bathyarchaeota archaeon]